MRLTCTHDPDAGLIRVQLEMPDTTTPERAADVAWAAVELALTRLIPTNGAPE
jgi:hypothetical protein